eukprot:jgi/Tetstr1/432759/TSEL_022125.t1
MFASSEPEALKLRQHVAGLLDGLGLLPHDGAVGARPWLWESVRYGQHLSEDIDTARGCFYAPETKLAKLSHQTKPMIQRAARNARWLHVQELQPLAGRAHHMYSAISSARFFLRGLRDVVGSKWGDRTRMMPNLH